MNCENNKYMVWDYRNTVLSICFIGTSCSKVPLKKTRKKVSNAEFYIKSGEKPRKDLDRRASKNNFHMHVFSIVEVQSN